MKRKEDLASLSEIARAIGVNKSKLSYYVTLGLIKPIETVGRMMIFDKWDTIDKLATIAIKRNSEKWQRQI